MQEQFSVYVLSHLREWLHSTNNAFFINEKYYTYHQLAERISAIRLKIQTWSTKEKVIALAIHDDLDTYAAIFALWMEGKAYVPLHPNQPIERNHNIISQVGSSYLLDSQPNNAYSDICTTISTVDLNFTEDCIDSQLHICDDELAYVLFTSGSTGMPKGVPLSRKNLAAFVRSFNDLGYNIGPYDRFLQCFDLTFDLSIMSYLIPLLNGACVYTVPYGKVKYINIIQLMEEYKLTFALMTPSTILYLRPYFSELNFPALQYCLFCGEALPTDAALEWSKCIPNAIIDNVYGPTENTIFCTTYRLRHEGNNVEHNGILSIGKTMTSGKVIIVDDNNCEVPIGNVGELCLSGKQLTQGYWNNSEKNDEVFWTAKDGTRYYRSGDMCFCGEDGNINFVGRKDSQVKINGYRIELSEIEYHAHQYLGHTLVLVMAFENKEGTQSLAMFIEAQEQDPQDLKKYLSEHLPSYMVPTRYIYESKFPINNSNKIDRASLKTKLNS